MTVLSSLPDRPLTEAEVSILNRSEPVTLAVAVDTDGTDADDADDGADPEDDAEDRTDDSTDDDTDDDDGDTRGILLATDDWVRGLAFVDGAWQAVATDEYDDSDDRYDALQQCESAVRAELTA